MHNINQKCDLNMTKRKNPQFTLDLEQATKSMEKLLSLKAKTYYCYHGGTFINN